MNKWIPVSASYFVTNTISVVGNIWISRKHSHRTYLLGVGNDWAQSGCKMNFDILMYPYTVWGHYYEKAGMMYALMHT